MKCRLNLHNLILIKRHVQRLVQGSYNPQDQASYNCLALDAKAALKGA